MDRKNLSVEAGLACSARINRLPCLVPFPETPTTAIVRGAKRGR
jgi:hypothetical protein